MRIMSTLKLLFSKITDDAPIYEKKDVVENIEDAKYEQIDKLLQYTSIVQKLWI